MWKEIIIGGDKTWKSWMAKSCWFGSNVTENGDSYMIRNTEYQYDVFVLKNSEQAKEFEILLENNKGNDEFFDNYSTTLLLRHLTLDGFKELLKEKQEESFKKGYKKAQSDIRKALGLPL